MAIYGLFGPYCGLVVIYMAMVVATRFARLLRDICSGRFYVKIFYRGSYGLFIGSVSGLAHQGEGMRVVHAFYSRRPVRSFLRSIMVVFGHGMRGDSFSRVGVPGQYTYTSVMDGLYRGGAFTGFQDSYGGVYSKMGRTIGR